MPATYEPIATTTLGSTSTTITFSSIPTTYTDLRLVFVGKASTNDDLKLTFNGSSATNYSRTDLYADGASVASSRAQGGADIRIASADGLNNALAFCTIDLFSYRSGNKKNCLITWSHDQNGAGYLYMQIGQWNLTDAITSMTLTQNANFAIGTTATLYGIKAA